MPPPSLEIMKDEELYKKYIDSVQKVPLKIGILKQTIIPEFSISALPSKYSSYNPLMENLKDPKRQEILDSEGWKISPNLELIFFTEIDRDGPF